VKRAHVTVTTASSDLLSTHLFDASLLREENVFALEEPLGRFYSKFWLLNTGQIVPRFDAVLASFACV
jgi:hypothetical protein